MAWPPGSADTVPPVFAILCGLDVREQAGLNARRFRVYDDLGRSTQLARSVGGVEQQQEHSDDGIDAVLIVHPHGLERFAGPPPFYAFIPKPGTCEYIEIPKISELEASLSEIGLALGARSVRVLVLVSGDLGEDNVPDASHYGDRLSFLSFNSPTPVLIRYCLRLLGVESLFESVVPGDES